MKKSIFAIALIAFCSFAAFADVRLPNTPTPTATPKQQKTIDSTFIIRLDPNANEAKLNIPKSQVQQLRAALDGLDDSEPLWTFSRTQTIVSGLFLSLAIVFGGVWFARARNGKANKTLIAGAILLLVGSAATMTFGNAGPPDELRSISGKLFDKKVFNGWRSAYGTVKVKVSNEGNTIELIVPDKPGQTNKSEE